MFKNRYRITVSIRTLKKKEEEKIEVNDALSRVYNLIRRERKIGYIY